MRKQVYKSFGVTSFCCGQKVDSSLKCGKFDIKGRMAKSLQQNCLEVILVVNQVIHDITKETVEDLECCVDFRIHFGRNKVEKEIK